MNFYRQGWFVASVIFVFILITDTGAYTSEELIFLSDRIDYPIYQSSDADIHEQSLNATSMVLGLEEAIYRALNTNLEIQDIKNSVKNLSRSRFDIYRSLLPTIETSFSGSRVISRGEEDTENYSVSFSLEQILYNQLKWPARFEALELKLEETELELSVREENLRRRIVELYVSIVFEQKNLNIRANEVKLYENLTELMRLEHELGSKTLLALVQTEKEQLELMLSYEKSIEGKRIKFIDLLHIVGLDETKRAVELDYGMGGIYKVLFGDGVIMSSDDLIRSIDFISGSESVEESLQEIAIDRDFILKKLKRELKQNRLQRELVRAAWLKNISLSYELSFTGEKFFPANTSHSIGINILFDFLFFSPLLSVNRSSLSYSKTRAYDISTPVADSVVVGSPAKILQQKAQALNRKLQNRKKEIQKGIDVWLVRAKTFLKTNEIYEKREGIIERNGHLMEARMELGEIKPVDYTKFLIEKSNFALEVENLNFEAIRLAWELESLTSLRFGGILNRLNVKN